MIRNKEKQQDFKKKLQINKDVPSVKTWKNTTIIIESIVNDFTKTILKADNGFYFP